MKIGIEALSFYTPGYYMDLRRLAAARGIDPDKFLVGIGQERMSVLPPDEDVITMGASAAAQALENVDLGAIDTLMFATESGIDQSKSGGVYIHRLLGLGAHCRTFEIKQACCSGTAALLMARAWVAARPDKKVLIVASDVARYELNSPGEATQGAGAVALVISAHPRLLEIEPENGAYTEDVMDFWRPNYREEAFVDGKHSIRVYLRALSAAWEDYARQSGRGLADFERFCYHMPFTRMAEKAHIHLTRTHGGEAAPEEAAARVGDSMRYNRIIGNTYTASLYIGLASLLENSRTNLGGRRLGLFSYGSGCMAMFLGGTVVPGYCEFLHADAHRRLLAGRMELDVPQYEEFYRHHLPQDGCAYATPARARGAGYRLAGIRAHQRQYEAVPQPAAQPVAEASALAPS